MNVFICFPVTHPDSEIFDFRIKTAKEHCWQLIRDGHVPLSPALVGLDLSSHLPKEERDISFPTWENFCYQFLELSDVVHVLKLEGWDTSKGVTAEIKKATELGIKIVCIEV